MQKLLLLIMAILAGGGGWYIGSWSGRDAIQALAAAKDLGKQAEAAHDKAQKALNKQLTDLNDQFQTGQKKLEDEHSRAKAEFATVLAGRDQRIADLGKARTGTQTRIVTLQQAVVQPGISAEERAKLQTEIDRLKKEVDDQKILIAGLECSKVTVPAELLAPMRRGQP